MEPQQEPQPEPQQQEGEAGGANAVPEQSAQENGAAAVEQHPGQDSGVFTLQQLPQDNHMSLPGHQTTDPNGLNSGLGLGHLEANGFMMPTQDVSFAAGTNGMAFPDPSLMMMAGQQLAMGGIPPPPLNGDSNGISADEIALYDRQIRLWGMQAQQKIRSANILLITMKALASEIAKNLVLAGVGSLTIVDDEAVNEADLGAGFCLSQEHLGQNRAQAASENLRKLNPRVSVFADPNSIMAKGASYFSAFDIVIATDLNPTTLAFINTATRLYNRQFYAAASHGFYGYIFSDLIEHDYVLQRDKSNVDTKVGEETRTRSVIDVKTKQEGEKKIEVVTKRELYSTWDLASETSLLPLEYRNSKRRLKAVTPALSCFRALWRFQADQNRNPGPNRADLEAFTKNATANHQLLSLPTETLKSEFLRSFLQNIGSEIAPVTAILGGQLAQDVINVLGASQPPIQNMVIFDGNKMQADMYPLHPEATGGLRLGRAQLEMGIVDMNQSLPPVDFSSMPPQFPDPAI
ncbi:hypothetical protein SUNI508_03989 [Seiridium unicorne]|uniref:Ubiquitin-like 1-activating enzyme E1A n=1 Tax=Seiridium unicorne TaxID=138068 RepID=A0ABR2VA66_9PEZI